MNHLASGGYLHNSCKAIFKTTPVNVGIRFETRSYPKKVKVVLPPPVQVAHEHFNRLFTGNVRAQCGFGRTASVIGCTFV